MRPSRSYFIYLFSGHFVWWFVSWFVQGGVKTAVHLHSIVWEMFHHTASQDSMDAFLDSF